MSVFGWTGMEGLRRAATNELKYHINVKDFALGRGREVRRLFEARSASFYSSHHERLPVDTTASSEEKSEV